MNGLGETKYVMKAYNFICAECGEELFGYYSESEDRYIIAPCEECTQDKYDEGKYQGYLEGNIDNLFEG